MTLAWCCCINGCGASSVLASRVFCITLSYRMGDALSFLVLLWLRRSRAGFIDVEPRQAGIDLAPDFDGVAFQGRFIHAERLFDQILHLMGFNDARSAGIILLHRDDFLHVIYIALE